MAIYKRINSSIKSPVCLRDAKIINTCFMVWLVHSAWRLVCGWNGDDSRWWMSKHSHRVCHITDVKMGARSEATILDSPWYLTTFSKNKVAVCSAVTVVVVGLYFGHRQVKGFDVLPSAILQVSDCVLAFHQSTGSTYSPMSWRSGYTDTSIECPRHAPYNEGLSSELSSLPSRTLLDLLSCGGHCSTPPLSNSIFTWGLSRVKRRFYIGPMKGKNVEKGRVLGNSFDRNRCFPIPWEQIDDYLAGTSTQCWSYAIPT